MGEGDQEAAVEAPDWRSTPEKLEAASVLALHTVYRAALNACHPVAVDPGGGEGSYAAWTVFLIFSMASEREVNTEVNRQSETLSFWIHSPPLPPASSVTSGKLLPLSVSGSSSAGRS